MGISIKTENQRRKEQSVRLREQILSAVEMVFHTGDPSEVTMDFLAEKAGVTKRTLYAYFASRETLTAAVCTRGFTRMNNLADEAIPEKECLSGRQQLRLLGSAFFRFAQEEPRLYQLITRYTNQKSDWESPSLEMNQFYAEGDRILDRLEQAIRTGQNDGSLNEMGDPAFTAFMIWGWSSGICELLISKKLFLEKKGIPTGNLVQQALEFLDSMLGKRSDS